MKPVFLYVFYKKVLAQTQKCKNCENEISKNAAYLKEINEQKIEIGKLKLEISQIKEREEKTIDTIKKSFENSSINEKNSKNFENSINSKLQAENKELKNRIIELLNELEELKSKGGAKVELIKLRTAYNELETKYKNIKNSENMPVFYSK